MKLLSKLALAATLCGAGATIYGAPGGWLGPNGPSAGAVTFEEMVTRAGSIHDKVLADIGRVQQLQRIARKDKDVIKLNCVNDKLIELKPLANIVERGQVELQSARTSSDQGAAFASIRESGDESARIREAAEQCIGQPLLTSESQNSFSHPDLPSTTSDDPSAWTIEPPAYASPYN